jgi:nucleoid-associated protein YgaU
MGLIQFVKNVGKKLDLSKKPPQQAQQRPAAGHQGPSAHDLAQVQERKREAALVELINGMGFKVRELAVDIEGSKALVRGQVDTQEEREKIILMAGNVEDIDAVDDRLQVSRPEPEAQFYDVKSGDNLSKIAKQFYGDANKYNLIFEANRPMLKDPDEIYPGQKLRIPAAAAATATARA